MLGDKPPAKLTLNEMTTVASVWTHAQFFDGSGIRGHSLGLKIAAGNVPSFVDLAGGGWGGAIQDPLNSSQTPTMANFATLADALSACVARVAADAHLWVGDNFTVGWQGKDDLWQGNASKFAPNGRPLSPMTTGFAGGGMQGGTFGAAVPRPSHCPA